jgi:hypothetical protein
MFDLSAHPAIVTLDLRDQLQAALGSTYTIHRELGGGGMARVFVATEGRSGDRSCSRCCARRSAKR